MNIWLKIEAFLNKILGVLFSVLSKFFALFIPKSLSRYAGKTGEQISENRKNVKNKIKERSKKIQQSLKAKTIEMKAKVEKGKVNLGKGIQKAKTTDYKSLNYKKIFFGIFLIFTPLFIKIKNWYITLKPTTILSLFTGISISTLIGINVYYASKKIVDETKKINNPEQVDEVQKATDVSKRPGYYKNDQKHLFISNVTMPVYVEDNGAVKSLRIDFTIETSNRYIREYLYKNDHLVKDRLNSTIEPVLPSFPLTKEGKLIIREKIQKELDVLLKKQKAQGTIKQIFFHSIVAG